jgi:hypothetical protein
MVGLIIILLELVLLIPSFIALLEVEVHIPILLLIRLLSLQTVVDVSSYNISHNMRAESQMKYSEVSGSM